MLTDRSAFYGQDLLVGNGKAWDPSTFERVKEMLKCLAFFLQTDLSLREKNPFFQTSLLRQATSEISDCLWRKCWNFKFDLCKQCLLRGTPQPLSDA